MPKTMPIKKKKYATTSTTLNNKKNAETVLIFNAWSPYNIIIRKNN